MAIRDGNWELDHQLSIVGVRYAWKLFDGEKMIVRFDYPVDPLIKSNQMFQNEQHGRFGEFERVASIPVGLYHSSGYAEAARQGDKAWMNRWLNDSDNAAWRVRGGQI